MNILILHNEKSGFRNRIKFILKIKKKLSIKHNVQLKTFRDINSLELDDVNQSKKDLNNLKNLDVPFLVIPTGTGNDFAKSLNMKLNVKSILKTIDKFDVQYLTSIISNKNEKIVNFICFGFAAKVNRLANRFPRFLGISKYTLATLISLFGNINESLKIESKNFNENGDYVLAMFVANSNNFGKHFPELKENQTHLLLINKISKLKFLYLFSLLQIRKHEGRKEFRLIPVDSLKVSNNYGELFPQADGETISKGAIELKMEFKNLQFLRN